MKILIEVSAYTKVYHSEVIEVPDNSTKEALDDLVRQKYEDCDNWETDNEYWEKGDCYWEKEN